jgi:hypothetical protein
MRFMPYPEQMAGHAVRDARIAGQNANPAGGRVDKAALRASQYAGRVG